MTVISMPPSRTRKAGPPPGKPPVPVADEPAHMGAAEVARMFELPEARLRYWSQTGFIVPTLRRGGRRYYGFRDLVSIKVAKELLDAGHPLQRVRRSLDALRDLSPESSPLARFRIRSDEGCIVVDTEAGRFEASTGQLLLDFDVEGLREQVAEVRALPWVAGSREPGGEAGVQGDPEGSAYDAFLHAGDLEARWVAAGAEEGPLFDAAVAAYELTVDRDPAFAAAWTNLGAMHAAIGDFDRARDLFDEALQCDPDQVEAACNLAELALRGGDPEVAIDGFRQVLVTVPDHIEAHYGLARALLQVGGQAQARAHLERFCAGVAAMPIDERGEELESRSAQARAVLESLRRGPRS